MNSYSIKKYTKEDHSSWNKFVANAKNATFLFHRDFMEYHSDRFEDYSLMIYQNLKLVGVLPANKKVDKIYSHQGLTYGGLVISDSIGGAKIFEITNSIIDFLKSKGFGGLIIKGLPVFYHQKPANEFLFFLSEIGGKIFNRDLNLAIDYSLPFHIHKSKRKHFEKRKHLGFEIEETTDFSEFWNHVLIPRLQEKHNTFPVHTLEEIMLLKKRFPKSIRQFVIRLENKVLGGITIFQTQTVVKSQYGAVTNLGEKHRALDFLFISLIKKFKEEGFHFFDMGTVTENNFGLLKQKEELGCEIYTQDFYRLNF